MFLLFLKYLQKSSFTRFDEVDAIKYVTALIDFYLPFQGSASFVDPFCYDSDLSLLYCSVCPLQPCDHLLWIMVWPLGVLVRDVSLCFVTFPYGFAGQVWYMIVSIPDISLHLYFKLKI